MTRNSVVVLFDIDTDFVLFARRLTPMIGPREEVRGGPYGAPFPQILIPEVASKGSKHREEVRIYESGG